MPPAYNSPYLQITLQGLDKALAKIASSKQRLVRDMPAKIIRAETKTMPAGVRQTTPIVTGSLRKSITRVVRQKNKSVSGIVAAKAGGYATIVTPRGTVITRVPYKYFHLVEKGSWKKPSGYPITQRVGPSRTLITWHHPGFKGRRMLRREVDATGATRAQRIIRAINAYAATL